MKRPAVTGAMIALAALAVSLPVLAATAIVWPWKDKMPPDPALAILSKLDQLSVTIKDQTLTVSVEAQAPTPGFTELQFTPRLGDPKDLIFAFDVRGRPPQDMTIQVISPVTVSAEYADAPIASVGVIEVYAQENCKAISVKDNKETACTAPPGPQLQVLPE